MKKISIFLFVVFTCMNSFTQVEINPLFKDSPEVIIKFQIQDRSEIDILTRIISIDKVVGNEVTAYTTPESFAEFLTLNIPFQVVEKPVLTPEYLNNLSDEDLNKYRNDWNYYPNYQQYLEMMNRFANDYPDICRLVEFGTSVQNRKLLACVISANVHVREAEPQVFLSSTMHGDELAGYVLMLRYIDYLLSLYGSDQRITHLLDNLEIWITPLANPDGTFWTGDESVVGAKRTNANSKDLNRNYFDWKLQGYEEGPEQKETTAFCNLQATENFTLSVNIHGGAEICNYPWDNTYKPNGTADHLWWQFVCREYADTVHLYSPPTYMTGYENGIVYGADWYRVFSSRQDYANYYNHTREFCLEVSNAKTPTATTLPNYWNYNYRSFLNYTQQATYGIHGIVTDANTGEPIYAKVFVNDYDKDNSFIMTDPRVGYYARLIKAGNYSITYSAEGYVSQTVSITVADRQKVIQNIQLVAPHAPVANFTANTTNVITGSQVSFTDQSLYTPTSWQWTFEGGTPATSTQQNPTITYDTAGTFDVKLTVFNPDGSDVMLKENYITVTRLPEFPVAGFEADKTEIFENETVSFTNTSENFTHCYWYFEGGTPETSTEINPGVLYENNGSFDVKLTVYNDDGDAFLMKENYIVVSADTLMIKEQTNTVVKIYPNPVLKNAALTLETDSQLRKIELINLLGEAVKTVLPNHSPYSFSTAGIEPGIYLLKVETKKGSYVAKIRIL